MKSKFLFVSFVLLCISYLSSGQAVGISETLFTPDSSSILHLQSSTKGLLVPRMTQAQRDAISSPATGLIIFQIDIDPFFYYFDGTMWQKMCCTNIICLLEAQITVSNDVSCFGYSDGSAEVTALNGTPPFLYSWSNSATTDSITGLPSGTYSVTITDSLMCTASTQVSISSPPQLSVSTGSNTPVTEGDTLFITSSPGGGTNPYTYNWAGPGGWTSTDQNPEIPNAQTTHTGTYIVTVTDDNGCTATSSTTVTVSTASAPPIPVVIQGNCPWFENCYWNFTIVDVGAAYYEMQIEVGGAWLSNCGSPWSWVDIITPLSAGSYEYCTLLASHGHPCNWPGNNGWLCCVWIRACNGPGNCSAWVPITGNCISGACNYVESNCITNL